jgi:hypothetical protein
VIFESAAHWAKDQLDTRIQKWFRYDNPGGSLVTCYLELLAPILRCGAAGSGLDVGSLVGGVVGGGAGGAILTIVAGVVKSMMATRQAR